MLRKFTLGLLALAISGHSFAFEIYKGTIISHKESTTGGIQGVLKEQPRQHTASLRALEDENSEDNLVEVDSRTQQQSVVLGQTTKIESDQSVFIINTTDATQEYHVNTSVCVEVGDVDKNAGQCYHIYDTVSLEPHGYYNENYMPELLMTFNDLSPKNLSANVEVSRALPPSDNFRVFDYIGSATSETNIIVTAQQ